VSRLDPAYGECNVGVPIACRECARAALRRETNLRGMLRRMVRQAWASCQVVPEAIVKAARIAKRKAGK
jgi:hypothetical protein